MRGVKKNLSVIVSTVEGGINGGKIDGNSENTPKNFKRDNIKKGSMSI